jgi:hypothetical protein
MTAGDASGPMSATVSIVNGSQTMYIGMMRMRIGTASVAAASA